MANPKAPRLIRKSDLTPSDIQRFWNNVRIGKKTECWPWKLGCDRKGYGKVKIKGRMAKKRTMKAHRVAYAIRFGSAPADVFVCHSCDNPPCCNPEHFFAGDGFDNMRDCAAKGRSCAAIYGPSFYKRGSAHATSILNEDQVMKIFTSTKLQREIAKEFKVSLGCVCHIRTGRNWRHLTGHPGPQK